MKAQWIAIVVALGACGKSNDDMKAEIAKQQAREVATPSEPVVETKKVEPAETGKQPEQIPEPDPSKPEEVDTARKQAMILGRDKEVIRFCEMGQIGEKSDPQARLGCALASCRLKEADKAKMWAKGIEKPLFEQAIKVCTPLGVTL